MSQDPNVKDRKEIEKHKVKLDFLRPSKTVPGTAKKTSSRGHKTRRG